MGVSNNAYTEPKKEEGFRITGYFGDNCSVIEGKTGEWWNWSQAIQLTQHPENSDIYYYTFEAKASAQVYWQLYVNEEKYWPLWSSDVETKSSFGSNESKASTDNQAPDAGYGRGASWFKQLTSGKKYTIYLNKNFNNSSSDLRLIMVEGEPFIWSARDLKVFPNGVYTENDMSNVEWPVYYLQSRVLNDNRITPEYQMQKTGPSTWELEFTYRNSKSEGESFDKIEQYIWVEGFASATAKSERKAKTTTNLLTNGNTLKEGRRYKATFNGSTLTFTDLGKQMPFISMLGKNWKQRDTDGRGYATPAGKNTNDGWQESWIQYNAKGQIARDREGKVMYNTYWPPKHNINFKSEFTVGNTPYDFTLSNEQLMLSPVLLDNGQYETKSGSSWMSDPKFAAYTKTQKTVGTKSTTKGLALDPDKQYTLYRVKNMWINGDVKIWTGWGGTTIDGTANWSSHANWGHYAESTSATQIQPEYTVPLSNREGDVKFDKPTYFKYVDFFYETSNPNEPAYSVFFTELAKGGAEIGALNSTNYDFGYYRPALTNLTTLTGLTIKGIKIDCYRMADSDADDEYMDNVLTETNLTLAPSSFGAHFTGNTTIGSVENDANNSKAKWIKFDKSAEYPNGNYYFTMVVTLSDGSEIEEVVSNPFIIYSTNVNTSVNLYQLVKVKGEEDNHYITFKGDNGVPVMPVYDIKDNGGQITYKSGTTMPDYGDAAQYEFTNKVLVAGNGHYAEGVDQITKYELNGVDKGMTNAQATMDNRFMAIVDQTALTASYSLKMYYTSNFGDNGHALNTSSTPVASSLTLTVPSPTLNPAFKIDIAEAYDSGIDIVPNEYRGATRVNREYTQAMTNNVQYTGARALDLNVTFALDKPNATDELAKLVTSQFDGTLKATFDPLTANETGVQNYKGKFDYGKEIEISLHNQHIMDWIKNSDKTTLGEDSYEARTHKIQFQPRNPSGLQVYERKSNPIEINFTPDFVAPSLSDGDKLTKNDIEGFLYTGIPLNSGKHITELYITKFTSLDGGEATLWKDPSGDSKKDVTIGMKTSEEGDSYEAYYSFGVGEDDGKPETNKLVGEDGIKDNSLATLISHKFMTTGSFNKGDNSAENAILVRRDEVPSTGLSQLTDFVVGIGRSYFFKVAKDVTTAATWGVKGNKAPKRKAVVNDSPSAANDDMTYVSFVPVHESYPVKINEVVTEDNIVTGVENLTIQSGYLVGEGFIDMLGTEGQIFSIDGRHVYSGNGRAYLASGVYVVATPGSTAKVLVK